MDFFISSGSIGSHPRCTAWAQQKPHVFPFFLPKKRRMSKSPSASAAEGFTFWKKEESSVETRVAVLAIIVRDTASVPALNELLHQYAPYIIGRMGVPYHARGVNIISVAVDAPADAISALSGKIGRLAGITAKTVYAPEDALQQGK